MLRPFPALSNLTLLLLAALPGRVLAGQVLTTTGYSSCLDESTISVQKMAVTYDNDAKTVTFNVAGSSTKAQNVSATVDVTAYGISVYSNSFNPCDESTFVTQLCPSKFFPSSFSFIYLFLPIYQVRKAEVRSNIKTNPQPP